MAKSEKLKQKRAAQVDAAHAQFEEYKDYIVQEFIDAFGGSYQTAANMKDVWRDSFIFRPECEKFLLKKTKMFLFFLDNKHINKSPCFLRTLIGKISEYLSKYICKKGISRNTCTQQLIKLLFTDDSYTQNKIKSYQREIAVSRRRPKTEHNRTPRRSRREKVTDDVRKAIQKKAVLNLKIYYVSEIEK